MFKVTRVIGSTQLQSKLRVGQGAGLKAAPPAGGNATQSPTLKEAGISKKLLQPRNFGSRRPPGLPPSTRPLLSFLIGYFYKYNGGGHSALLRDGSAWCRERPLPGWGSLCGMAMAEGERTECAETPRDEPPADGTLKRAEELKTQANDYFKAKDYENAIKFYSQAIELNPGNAIYYGNRSLAYLRTECYGYALGDATRAIELDKKYIKGYYRRAASNMALGKFRAALRDYETVVKVKPNDKDAKMKYQECSKIVKQKAFERAIAGDEHRRSVVDSLDIESMTIEDEYSGPKLEDGKVTITFMKDLMQWYKDQKKLHRKCAYQILVQVKEVLCKLSTLVETTLKEVRPGWQGACGLSGAAVGRSPSSGPH